MNYVSFNPVVRSVSLYEKNMRSEECVAYDSRLIYAISGDIAATVGGKKLGHIGPGSLLYIPAGMPYRLKSKYMRAVAVSFDPTDDRPLPEERIAPVPVADYDESLAHKSGIVPPLDDCILLTEMESEHETFVNMSEIFTSAEGLYRAQLSAMVKLVVLKLVEVSDESALPARMVESLDSYIRENCSDEISNTEIGAIFGYHPFYVSRMLKDKKGMTLRQYIIAYRLKRAKRLLELTDKSAQEIAEECGFTDASYFAKSFKSAFGVTPKDYRNGFKNDFI